MKRIVIAIGISLALLACGGQDDKATQAADKAVEKTQEAANVLLRTPIDPAAFSAADTIAFTYGIPVEPSSSNCSSSNWALPMMAVRMLL